MPSPSTGATETISTRARAILRIAGLMLLFAACLPPHLIAKAVPGRSRWPRRFLGSAARICGARVRIEGAPLAPHSLVLANHSSWLDILILGGIGTAFVSKAEIERVPLIGWLADQNRTLYIARADRGDAHGQVRQIARALGHPQPLTIFPEGTTGDGRPLLPFRSTLLAAVAPPPERVRIRPVAIDYGADAVSIAWTSGERGLANALRVLGLSGRREVTVHLLDPLDHGTDRKAVARSAQAAIATALSSADPRNALEAPAR